MKNDVFSVTFIKAKTASRGEGDEMMMMKETNPQIASKMTDTEFHEILPQRILGILLTDKCKITVCKSSKK